MIVSHLHDPEQEFKPTIGKIRNMIKQRKAKPNSSYISWFFINTKILQQSDDFSVFKHPLYLQIVQETDNKYNGYWKKHEAYWFERY